MKSNVLVINVRREREKSYWPILLFLLLAGAAACVLTRK